MILSVGLTGTAFAQNQDLPPAAAETRDTGRIFLDGRVAEVYVDNVKTIAVMPEAPQSNCPSTEYVYERDRPKWLYETGRLLVAAEEGADIRISFTCYGGLQSINAIQFLSPSTRRVTSGTPQQSRLVPTAADQRNGLPPSRNPDTRQETRSPGTAAAAVSDARGAPLPTGGVGAAGGFAPPPPPSAANAVNQRVAPLPR
ncbi:hypothetical protein DLJ53_14810 [Acuticoccus sediminis]|uniref:Uncharacterized protein n=1 Tax=Acuticoccus sediminis TaxID=2184697 RepID=A0A8B2NTM5_9HYPH|nr:hypothetical protein [Acuticoccus sediminis]RAI00533.1 hypothetical protein DLJ53_14810 [Acuticoccus sediminis]